MLIDPKIKKIKYDPKFGISEYDMRCVTAHLRHAPGVYQTISLTPHNIIFENVKEMSRRWLGFPYGGPEWKAYWKMLDECGLSRDFSDYGVCDHYQQILDKYPGLATAEHKFMINVVEIRKDHQPPQDGWRWHKWGEYIGDHEPQCEYLFDEKDIERVYVFHIYEVEV